jgi:hypothetical protein
MKGQERQMIIKARWSKLPDHEKTLYVAKARFEEESQLFK